MTYEVPKRAEWQRSEGMVILTELCERIFPLIEAECTAEAIAHRLEPIKHGTPLYIAQEAAGTLVNALWSNEAIGQVEAVKSDFMDALRLYTFEGENSGGISGVMYEAMQTTTNFPFNLLRRAETIFGSEDPTYRFRDLDQVAQVLRADWFHDVCHVAALAPSTLWGDFSIYNVDNENWELRRKGFLSLEKTQQGTGSFAFSDESVQQLHAVLRARNRRFITQQHTPDMSLNQTRTKTTYEDNWEFGSSSGCPVRHAKPHYPPTGAVTDRLPLLAETLEKTSEELLAPRERTGIDIGLDTVANIVERAARLLPEAYVTTIARGQFILARTSIAAM